MKKSEMLVEIQDLVTHLELATDYAGKPVETLLFFDPRVQCDRTHEETRHALSWLKSVYTGEYTDWRKYYLQAAPDYWRKLESYGDPEVYPEYLELQHLTRDLIKRMRKERPDFFKKSKNRRKKTKHTNTEE